MGTNAQNARNYIFNQAPKRESVLTPFWPDLDGKVSLQDVPTDEIIAAQEAKMADGRSDTARNSAGVICKALVIVEEDGTYSPVFVYPDDVGQVAKLGMSLLMPVINQANTFFGFSSKAVEQAKNDSGPTQNSSSGTGSVIEASIVP